MVQLGQCKLYEEAEGKISTAGWVEMLRNGDDDSDEMSTKRCCRSCRINTARLSFWCCSVSLCCGCVESCGWLGESRVGSRIVHGTSAGKKLLSINTVQPVSQWAHFVSKLIADVAITLHSHCQLRLNVMPPFVRLSSCGAGTERMRIAIKVVFSVADFSVSVKRCFQVSPTVRKTCCFWSKSNSNIVNNAVESNENEKIFVARVQLGPISEEHRQLIDEIRSRNV